MSPTMERTLCPECGFGPVGNDACPNCGTRFDQIPSHLRFREETRPVLDEYREHTDFDYQLPDVLGLHPYAAAATFAVAALAFGLEAAGVVGSGAQAPLRWALALVNALLAGGIALRLSISRLFAYMLVPVQIVAVLWIGRAQPLDPTVIFGVLFFVAAVAGMILEPERTRRIGALVVAIVLVGGRLWGVANHPEADPEQAAHARLARLGVGITLPPGLVVLDSARAEELLPLLPAPSAPAAVLPFADPSRDFAGYLLVEQQPTGHRAALDPLNVFTHRVLSTLDVQEPPEELALFEDGLAGLERRLLGLRLRVNGQDRRAALVTARSSEGPFLALLVLVPASQTTVLRATTFRILKGISYPAGGTASKNDVAPGALP
jgi:hypothetical protein